MLAAFLLWSLRPVLTPFLLGAIVAYVLQPGVEWLVRHRVPRGLAALLVIALLSLLAASLILLGLLVIQKEGPLLTRQLPSFAARLDAALRPRLAYLGLSYSLDMTNLRDALAAHLIADEHSAASALWQYLCRSGDMMVRLVGNLVLVPLVLFYLLYDRHEAFERMESFVPRRWLTRTRDFAAEIDHMMSQYLRGQVLVAAILSVFYPAALALAGLEIALPVGLLTALAVFIPYVGFATALALALLAAGLQFGDWYGIGAVVVVYATGQVLESVFLTPRLVGERIGLHPLAVIFALLAFGKLFGFFGVLLALPASAVFALALRELRRRYLRSSLYRA
ncbi:AI-2E family transporter [Paraburkholderia caribensis]|uniref:AI-2E family transporter n=1 Tax=Paraburkholderia caribensis TaxID=75105 RepID=UPI001F36DCC7|nr:AI-2E family transporter [Paraburkholderia caribensis]